MSALANASLNGYYEQIASLDDRDQAPVIGEGALGRRKNQETGQEASTRIGIAQALLRRALS
jgi:hypothetical protein